MENITVADSDPVNEQCLDDEFYPNIDLDNLDLKDIQFDKMKLPYLAYHSTLDRFLLPDYGKFNSFDELNFKIQEVCFFVNFHRSFNPICFPPPNYSLSMHAWKSFCPIPIRPV